MPIFPNEKAPPSSALPTFLKAFVDSAVERLSPRRIWLFGSRARGDYTPLSDVDLAFEGPFSRVSFGAFASESKDEARTLLALDLVDMNHCAPELSARIESEGVVLYDQGARQ